MKLADGLAWFGAVSVVAATIALGTGGWDRTEVLAVAALAVAALVIFGFVYKDAICDWWYGIGKEEIRPAREQDAEAIHSLAQGYFGQGISSFAQIRSMVSRHETTYWVLQSRSSDNTRYQIEGFVCVIPLTQRLVDKIETYSFSVADLVLENMPRKRADVAAIYIGAIVGTKYRARAKILGFIEDKVKGAASKSSSGAVYAKAATNHGLRLLVNNEFEPVNAAVTGVNAFYKKQVR